MVNHSKTLRKQINDAFDASALDVFLYDYFPEVRAELTPGMSKSQWITLLLAHSGNQPGKLQDALQRERPNIDWAPYFESKPPPLPPVVPKSASRLLYLGGALSFLIVAVAFVVMNGRLPIQSERDTVTPSGRDDNAPGETVVVAPADERETNQSCPENFNDAGEPQLLDLPTGDVISFMPPSDDTWPANPSLVHPVKRHFYRGTLQVGDTVSDVMLGKYPDQCLIHAYILESDHDGLITVMLSEDGFRGQGVLIFNTTSKELTRDQAIGGTVTLTVPVAADKRYLIEVMNWNFDGGEYELSVTAAD